MYIYAAANKLDTPLASAGGQQPKYSEELFFAAYQHSVLNQVAGMPLRTGVVTKSEIFSFKPDGA